MRPGSGAPASRPCRCPRRARPGARFGADLPRRLLMGISAVFRTLTEHIQQWLALGIFLGEALKLVVAPRHDNLVEGGAYGWRVGRERRSHDLRRRAIGATMANRPLGCEMRCLECGAEPAETVQACVRRGAPAGLHQPVAVAPAAGGPGSAIAPLTEDQLRTGDCLAGSNVDLPSITGIPRERRDRQPVGCALRRSVRRL